jgi:predicted RNA-binding protein with PIN domain
MDQSTKQVDARPFIKSKKGIAIIITLIFVFLLGIVSILFLLNRDNNQVAEREDNSSSDTEEIEELPIEDQQLNYDLTNIENVEEISNDEISLTNLTTKETKELSKEDAISFLSENFYQGELSILTNVGIDNLKELIKEIGIGNDQTYVIVNGERGLIIFVLNPEFIITSIYYEHTDEVEDETISKEDDGQKIDETKQIKIWVNGSDYKNQMWTTKNGAETMDMTIELRQQNIDLKNCTLSMDTELDDDVFTKFTTSLPAVEKQVLELEDGTHVFKVICNQEGETISNDFLAQVADNQPKKCKNFEFVESDITVSNFDELKESFVGKWQGCVSTHWIADYYAEVEFRSDGTYSAFSGESLDEYPTRAFYYGTDEDDPRKKYFLSDFLASKNGTGGIDITFDSGSVNRGDLKNIKIMGEKMKFEFFKNGYGPVTFRLNRVQ